MLVSNFDLASRVNCRWSLSTFLNISAKPVCEVHTVNIIVAGQANLGKAKILKVPVLRACSNFDEYLNSLASTLR